MMTILAVLLFVGFIAWLIALFARGRGQAPLSDMAFFATGIVIREIQPDRLQRRIGLHRTTAAITQQQQMIINSFRGQIYISDHTRGFMRHAIRDTLFAHFSKTGATL